MSQRDYQPRRVFTLEEASRMLPLVEAITRDVVELAGGVLERRERIAELLGDRTTPPQGMHRDELEEAQQQLEHDAHRLRDYVAELTELGVELKGLDGLVDFPSYRGDRLVYLCWKLGEGSIQYWHELDAGFDGRQRISGEAAVPAGGQSLHNSVN